MKTPHDNPTPHLRDLIPPYKGVGLFITATNTDMGKTTVTAALAAALHRLHLRVGICKPVASGCPPIPGHKPGAVLGTDDLSCPDAETVMAAAGLDTRDPVLHRAASPMRYALPVSPHIAARVEGRPVDWNALHAAFDFWSENCDVLLVEGAGGWLVPLDEQGATIADLATALRLPVLVVTDATMGTLNFTALTVQAIRQRGLNVVGMVINHVPNVNNQGAEAIVIGTNLTELPRLCGVPVRAVLPQLPAIAMDGVPESFIRLLDDFAAEWKTQNEGKFAP